jgi:hypothetical protein
MEPLSTQAEMLMLEVITSYSIILVHTVKVGGDGYNSGKFFTINACIKINLLCYLPTKPYGLY